MMSLSLDIGADKQGEIIENDRSPGAISPFYHPYDSKEPRGLGPRATSQEHIAVGLTRSCEFQHRAINVVMPSELFGEDILFI